MLAERWREIENLYHTACELEPERRRAYLERACGTDESLRREVESLLANEGMAASFLETGPMKRSNGSWKSRWLPVNRLVHTNCWNFCVRAAWVRYIRPATHGWIEPSPSSSCLVRSLQHRRL